MMTHLLCTMCCAMQIDINLVWIIWRQYAWVPKKLEKPLLNILSKEPPHYTCLIGYESWTCVAFITTTLIWILVLHPQQYPWLNTYFWFGHYMVCSKGPALILVQQGWYYLKWLPSKYWYKGVGTSQCLFLLNSGQHMVVCLQLATTTGLQQQVYNILMATGLIQESSYITWVQLFWHNRLELQTWTQKIRPVLFGCFCITDRRRRYFDFTPSYFHPLFLQVKAPNGQSLDKLYTSVCIWFFFFLSVLWCSWSAYHTTFSQIWL